MNDIPRWYQAKAVDAVLFGWEECDRVLLNSATGSGKNYMMAKIVKAVLPERCLVISDQTELCTQSADAVSRFADIVPAIDKAGTKARLGASVVVSSVQTLSKKNRLERYPSDYFSYIIQDEIHRDITRKMGICDYFKNAKVCGMTATAFRADVCDLTEWFPEVAFSMPMLDLEGKGNGLIEAGFAPPIVPITPQLEIDLAGVKTKRGFDGQDYDASSLATTIEPILESAMTLIKEHVMAHPTIVFLPLISTSKACAEIARRVGISAMHVDGGSEDRDEIIENFRRRRFQMLCNASLCETGVDIPIADTFVNLQPTRSAVKYRQSLGRIMRPLPGVIDHLPGEHQAAERKAAIAASAKPCAYVFDFLWQHEKLAVQSVADLIATSKEDALGMAEKIKKLRSPEQLEEIARKFQAEKEAKLVKQLEEGASKFKPRVPVSEFGFLIGNRALMRYEPTKSWHREPPSPKQLGMLNWKGIEKSSVKYKGEAAMCIDAIMYREAKKLASPKNLKALREAGIEFDARTLPDFEAARLLREKKSKKSVALMQAVA